MPDLNIFTEMQCVHRLSRNINSIVSTAWDGQLLKNLFMFPAAFLKCLMTNVA